MTDPLENKNRRDRGWLSLITSFKTCFSETEVQDVLKEMCNDYMLTGLDWIWIIWSSRTSQVNFLQPQVESDSSSRTGICVPTQVGKKDYQILPGQVSSRRWDLITPRKTRGYVVGHPLPETQGHPLWSPHTIRSLLQWSRYTATCEDKSVQRDTRPQRSVWGL